MKLSPLPENFAPLRRGKLTALGEAWLREGVRKGRKVACQCDCGREKPVLVPYSHWLTGHRCAQQCGNCRVKAAKGEQVVVRVREAYPILDHPVDNVKMRRQLRRAAR